MKNSDLSTQTSKMSVSEFRTKYFILCVFCLLSTILRAQLPKQATRLLNRSRMQEEQQQQEQEEQQQSCKRFRNASFLSDPEKESSLIPEFRRRLNSPQLQQEQDQEHFHCHRNHSHHHSHQQHQQQHQHPSPQYHRDLNSWSDDQMLYDKSFRNAMIQEVLQFKKQLLRLRHILQGVCIQAEII